MFILFPFPSCSCSSCSVEDEDGDEEEDSSSTDRKLFTHGAVLGRLDVNARISVRAFDDSYALAVRRPWRSSGSNSLIVASRLDTQMMRPGP